MEQAVIKAEKISFSYPGSNWTFGPLDLEITGNVYFSGKPIQDFSSKEFSKLVGFLPQKVTTQFDFTGT